MYVLVNKFACIFDIIIKKFYVIHIPEEIYRKTSTNVFGMTYAETTFSAEEANNWN